MMGRYGIAIDTRFDLARIGEVRHNLVDHPLLTIDRLRALATRLSGSRLRWHRGDLAVSSHFGRAAAEHANGRSLDDTLASIEHAGSWVFFQHIEEDPSYAGLVHEVLDGFAATARVPGGVRAVAGWVFVASPEAVTPYHMDHETNFLLQIRGHKTVSVWDPADRSIVGELALEHFHGAYSLDQVAWRDELATRARTFAVRPGLGVFMPFTAPHAVVNGSEVSVTLSLTFVTRANVREQRAFAANRVLRRVGLRPRPVGRSAVADVVKAEGLHIARSGHGALGRARARLGSSTRSKRAQRQTRCRSSNE